MLSPHTLTAKKQTGKSFTHPEIEFIVNGYTSGNISDDEMTRELSYVGLSRISDVNKLKIENFT